MSAADVQQTRSAGRSGRLAVVGSTRLLLALLVATALYFRRYIVAYAGASH